MSLDHFYRFQDLARQQSVVFYYTGYFSQAIVSAMGDALRQRLNQTDASNMQRRKLFSVFIEMAQNVVHYSAEHLSASDSTDQEIRRGALWVGEQDSHFYVVCANPVAREQVGRIRDKLMPLLGMSNDDIKQLYKQKLRSDNDAESKGAGLGFLTVARDATEPVEFDFIDEDGPLSPITMFYLKASI